MMFSPFNFLIGSTERDGQALTKEPEARGCTKALLWRDGLGGGC